MKSKTPYLAIPGTVFVGVSLGLVIIYTLVVSFWSMKGFIMVPSWTLKNYVEIFSNWLFHSTILFTIRETFIILGIILIISYPVAYFLARVIKSQRLKLILLMLCIIPFWTSYVTRMVTWIPMLGREGLLNGILLATGIISEPASILLFSEPAMIFVMVFLYSVFCVGPIYFSMARIDEEVIESASDLGAGGFQTFFHVIVPLSLPGVATGAFFVIVMVIGEYATPAIIGGNKFPMLGNNIMAQSLILQWTSASAYSIILMGLTLAFVIILFRLINIRKLLR
ncbi:MAG: ABC transporter permease subunit [Proteobacteria bacterium]|nr:ABC transporter permease subunit [Pseudomonadota bacterium]